MGKLLCNNRNYTSVESCLQSKVISCYMSGTFCKYFRPSRCFVDCFSLHWFFCVSFSSSSASVSVWLAESSVSLSGAWQTSGVSLLLKQTGTWFSLLWRQPWTDLKINGWGAGKKFGVFYFFNSTTPIMIMLLPQFILQPIMHLVTTSYAQQI